MAESLVFNVQKCSIHDGPGIRTLVFLKGCPLRCLWCANPESQDFQQEISSSYGRCIQCGACLDACPEHCITFTDGRYLVDHACCTRCGKCASVCYAESKRLVGREISSEELLAEVVNDAAYYRRSGGGVTVSGGEPLCHAEFLGEFASQCKRRGIPVAIETCGWGNHEAYLPALEHVDLIMFDLKHADPQKHQELTGYSNEQVLESLRQIDQMGKRIIIRIPLIPGINDCEDNLRQLAGLICQTKNVEEVELLPYHAMGAPKYEMLGREYQLKNVKTPSDERMEHCAAVMNEMLHQYGKHCSFEKKK